MTSRGRTVVQVERLRDQVYRLIRGDLRDGELLPGQRIFEGELASRYGVSRTPVREALFQLSREGLVRAGPDRGYVVAMDSPDDTAHRHEVRGLIDPRLARHAALDATEAQKRAFARAHELQARAHEGGAVAAFIEANGAFRDLLRSLSGNSRLAECSAMIDDQAQWARRTAFARADYRALELAHDAELVEAVAQGDADAAEAAMRRYIAAVSEHLVIPALDP